MKQFQKYGVAAAVAAVSATAIAQTTERSDQNLGDAAIVPYYTTTGGKVTGVHIINTTEATQVVKFRMRRGSDSRDAMDFNIIMSPKDEWVTSIQTNASPSDGKGGVKLITDDTTCTAPIFDADGTLAEIPATYAEGAEEGYIEIIGMGQPTTEKALIAVSAKHSKGVPKDCAGVEYNFLRVADDDAGDKTVQGVHHSELTNQVSSAGATGLTNYTDTPDRALKVSWFIRDADGGLEVGGNAVHIEGFANGAMMTNQEQLVFNTDKLVEYDPFNFELPNLNVGSYPAKANGSFTRTANHSTSSSDLFNRVRDVMGSEAIHNEWSDKATDGSTVNTDWVITLPGQYLSEDPFCVIYEGYPVDGKSCSVTTASLNDTEIPLYLSKKGTAKFTLYDREETVLVDTKAATPPGLSFSPANGTETEEDSQYLPHEVNVLAFDRDGTSDGVLESEYKISIKLPEAAADTSTGWMSFDIEAAPKSAKIAAGTGNQFVVTGNGTTDAQAQGVGVPVFNQSSSTAYGAFSEETGPTVVLGMAVWKREFANNAAAAYGRAVEHSYTTSSGIAQVGRVANAITP